MINLYHTYDEKIMEIPTMLIKPNLKVTPKEYSDEELYSLMESIRRVGLIHPITVRSVDTGYEVVSGLRRLCAAKLAGIYTMPCFIIEGDDCDAIILSISENIHQSPMHYFDQARLMRELMRRFGLSEEHIALKLGKNIDYVKNKVHLLKIPEYIQEFIKDNHLKERHARSLLRVEDERLMLKAASAAIKSRMNVGQLDAYIDKLTETSKKIVNFGFCRDLRLYLNTINHTVDIMKNSGINTMLEKLEDDESITYRIVINK